MSPKLSKEEKKALKAAKKAEKKRLAAIKARQLKIDELQRELKYGRLTVKRHEKSWKDLLLSIGIPEIKKQLEYAWHNFEIAIDAKDFQISLLMDAINEAEEQYMMNIRNHCENVNKLFLLFKEQLEALNQDSKAEVRNMRMFNELEVERLMSKHRDDVDFLNMMLFGLEMMQKEHEQYIRCEYCARMEDEQNKNNEALQKLSFDIHEKYMKVWNDTMDFVTSFNDKTAQKRKQYLILNAAEEQVNTLMQNQLERIAQLFELIRKLKYETARLHRSIGQKAGDLIIERYFYADTFWSLKSQLEKELNFDDSKLTLFTIEANEAMDTLKKIETKGSYILQLASMCRKYETIQEKVLPFPMLGKNIKVNVMDCEYFRDVYELKTFWKRFGQADAIRYSMYEEKKFLESQNKGIRQKIHQYCECLNCVAYENPGEQLKPRVPIINIDGGLQSALKFNNQDFGFKKN
ncbi:dynein regulatory complex subunit 2-like [Onthophagus taurus]|uniref:dynein regulatory complex subunit 2-like n=1 Tax=Onthophagus taurus TaxID=166361 RepID=UPI000C2053AD|nr:coiled-coil domain-containing protein 65-like [Onthophagus taurus]